MGEGEWMNESRLGVWTACAGVWGTGPGVGGIDGPEGRSGKRSFENWDWMSPKEREVVIGSREESDSHNAGDSGRGEKADLWGVVWVNAGFIRDGDRLERICEGGEKFVPLRMRPGDWGWW